MNNIFKQLFQYGFHDTELSSIYGENLKINLIFNNGNGAWADMCSIKWNPFNTDENKAAASNYVSFYKGVPVFRTNGCSMSLLAIFLTRNGFPGTSRHYWTPKDILKHEWGHSVQQMLYGPIPYLINIGIPSVFIDNSDNAPWEIHADILGGVSRPYSEHDARVGWDYFIWGRIITPFWWW